MSGVYWQVHYRRSNDFGASFGPEQNLHIPPHATYAPSVAAFGNRVHVLLKRDNYGSDQIWMWTSIDSGATFLPDTPRVDDGAIRYPSGTILDYVNPAEVVVHDDGSITVAFVDNTSGDADVLVDRSVDGGMTFRRDARVDDAPPGVDSVNPSLAGGAGTNVVVAWEDDRSDQPDIYFRRVDAAVVDVPPVNAQPTVMRIQARPNPFRKGTVLAYTLPSEGYVLLEVLDVTGRSVCTLVDNVQAAGAHLVEWNGLDDSKGSASAGVYWIRLRSAGTMRGCKVVFLP
jgi:hypothetical protein